MLDVRRHNAQELTAIEVTQVHKGFQVPSENIARRR